jgi:secreted trypsin-like serine protease
MSYFRFLTILPLALMGQVVLAHSAGFTLSVSTTNRVEASLNGGVPQVRESNTSASLSIQGTESSECENYGRQSAVLGAAQTEVVQQQEGAIDLRLKANVHANGGHFRTCLLGCSPEVFGIKKKCLAIHGNNTSANISATAVADIKITFDPKFPPTDYEFDVAVNSDSPTLVTVLKDEAGNSIPIRRENGESQILRGRPGAVYFLSLKLPLEASDAGGCCSQSKAGAANILAGIRIQRAPILDAQSKLVPYIAGGEQTTAYPYVGAFKVDNKVLCTGTLVGTSTVLTAAHCVYGFEERLRNSGIYIVGSNINQPDEAPIKVVGYDLPANYNPETLENDIAVIYLQSTPSNGKLVSLHTGVPAWAELVSKKVSLTFVGFGYDVDDGQQVGRGVKREASWFMNEIQPKTVSFGAADKGTCKGDSGGPALLVKPGQTMQVAVTSGGRTDSCKEGGVETRVDFYHSWISPRIK